MPKELPKTVESDAAGACIRGMALGDESALTAFVADLLPRLKSFAQAVLRRKHLQCDLASDVLNDAIVVSVKWIRKHPKRDVSESWLRTIIYRRIIDVARSSRNFGSLDDVAEPSNELNQQQEDDRERLEMSLKLLTPSERDLMKLIFEDSLPLKDVARQLGISYWSCHKRYTRVLLKLRSILVELGEDEVSE